MSGEREGVDVEALRALAEAVSTEHRIKQTLLRGVVRCSCGASSVGDPYWAEAHPGWSVSRDDATQVWDERERLVASAEGLDEAAYIAAANPAVITALLDRLAAAEGALERVRALDRGHIGEGCTFPDDACRCTIALFDLRAALDGERDV